MCNIIEIITIILGIMFLLWIFGFWIYISCEQAYRFEGKFKTYFHDINGYHIPDTKNKYFDGWGTSAKCKYCDKILNNHRYLNDDFLL